MSEKGFEFEYEADRDFAAQAKADGWNAEKLTTHDHTWHFLRWRGTGYHGKFLEFEVYAIDDGEKELEGFFKGSDSCVNFRTCHGDGYEHVCSLQEVIDIFKRCHELQIELEAAPDTLGDHGPEVRTN